MPDKITKDMTIGEVLEIDDGIADVFLSTGMECTSCPISLMETVEEAAWVHGVELDLILTRLNVYLKYLKGQQKKKEG